MTQSPFRFITRRALHNKWHNVNSVQKQLKWRPSLSRRSAMWSCRKLLCPFCGQTNKHRGGIRKLGVRIDQGSEPVRDNGPSKRNFMRCEGIKVKNRISNYQDKKVEDQMGAEGSTHMNIRFSQKICSDKFRQKIYDIDLNVSIIQVLRVKCRNFMYTQYGPKVSSLTKFLG